jgi:hypothetical protein
MGKENEKGVMTLDWTNAQWANGPKFVKWCEENNIEYYRDDVHNKWKQGRNVQIGTVDKLMVFNLRHISELPDDIWIDLTTNGHKKKTSSAR